MGTVETIPRKEDWVSNMGIASALNAPPDEGMLRTGGLLQRLGAFAMTVQEQRFTSLLKTYTPSSVCKPLRALTQSTEKCFDWGSLENAGLRGRMQF